MNRQRLASGVLSLFLLIGIALFALPRAGAQQENDRLDITTSPLPINLRTDPGETVSTELRVRNNGISPERLQVGLLKFGANDTSGQPRLADREPGDDYFDWVSFSEDQFTAEPNVWKTITMTIDVPDSAGLGYYYAVTFTRAQDAQAEEGASVHGGTAVMVLLEVYSPNAKRAIEISAFSASRSVYEFLPAEFSMEFNNTGNIHLIPAGSIFITRGSQQVAVLPVNDGKGNVLPASSRVFTAAWHDGWPKYVDIEENGRMVKNDDGTPKRRLDWSLSNAGPLRFGKYKATLLAVYDDGQRDVPVEAVLTFWVIPWRIIFFGLAILALIMVGPAMLIRRAFRRRGKRVESK